MGEWELIGTLGTRRNSSKPETWNSKPETQFAKADGETWNTWVVGLVKTGVR